MQGTDGADFARAGPGAVLGEFVRRLGLPTSMSRELVAEGNRD